MSHAIHRRMSGMMLIATLPSALAQVNYPTQSVRVIVTTSPGGGLDTFDARPARAAVATANQHTNVRLSRDASRLIDPRAYSRVAW